MERNEVRRDRKWWIAGLLSFFVPGLGQVYNGEATKGLFYYFLLSVWGGLVFSLLYEILKHPTTRTSLGILFLLVSITLAAYLFITFESIRRAIRIGTGHVLKPYNRWYIYLIVILVVTGVDQCVSFAVRDNILQPYQIPTESMQPTIEAGDHVLCNQLYYRFHNPQREDLVIFNSPTNESDRYIKRIVGMPGDEIELRENVLFLNGREVDESYTGNDQPANCPGYRLSNFGPITVPENEYFVLGDDRCNSLDSRSFGTVKRHSIQGRAIFIYFSWDKKIPAWNIIGRVASIRISRIGKIL